jgi:hypothetical protein
MSPKWQKRWIEIFLLGGILLIIASFVSRIVYGQQMREAEEHLVARLGISDDVYFISKTALAIFAIVYFGIRYGKSKKFLNFYLKSLASEIFFPQNSFRAHESKNHHHPEKSRR